MSSSETIDIEADTSDGGERAAPLRTFGVPRWAADAGRWSWIIIGALILLIALLALASATRVLVVSALFAVLLGGTFLPVVDWLAKHRFPRWLGAMLVAVFLVALAVGIALVITYSVVNQVPEIQQRLTSAAAEMKKALNATSVPPSTVDSAKAALQDVLKNAASGVAGTLAAAIDGVASLLFGVFISLNILVWVLIQGRQMGTWASRHMGSVPQPVGYAILANSARFFRGYLWGSTLTGLFNGGVMFVGALIIGVPLAATIGIVGWFTNYIPFFGAIISGAFAVLIALGAGGPSKAIPMLIIVIISNGYLQTDVDLEHGRLLLQRQRKCVRYGVRETQFKTDKPRPVSLDAETVAALRRQSQRQLDDAAEWKDSWLGEGHVFTREDGEPWHPDRVRVLFQQALKVVGMRHIRMHDLRHTWATLALRAGVHPKVVQERLGHANIRITLDTYSHVLPDMQESAAELVASIVAAEAN